MKPIARANATATFTDTTLCMETSLSMVVWNSPDRKPHESGTAQTTCLGGASTAQWLGRGPLQKTSSTTQVRDGATGDGQDAAVCCGNASGPVLSLSDERWGGYRLLRRSAR